LNRDPKAESTGIAADFCKLQEDLKDSESRYRCLFEGSKDMIFITFKDGSFQDVNQAAVDLLEYDSKEDLLSVGLAEKVYDNAMHWKVFRRQIDRDGFVKDFEAKFRKKDGNLLHCLLSGNAVWGKEGEIIGYQGIAKDITARMDAIRNFRQRHRELWVLNSVAFAMNKSRDLDTVLQIALTKALEVLGLTAGAIFLIDHDHSAFVLKSHHGFQKKVALDPGRIKLHDAALMKSLLEKDLVLTPEPIFPPFRAVFSESDGHASATLTCFLITAKEKASGFLALEVPPDRDITRGQDFHLLGSLSNFLGGAIENASLVETIARHREELKGLTARLFHSQEMERKRIARELHDEAGQALTGINFTLETIDKELSPEFDQLRQNLLHIRSQINRTYHEMRRISYRLHPAILSDLGLEPALDAYIADISKHSALTVDFKMVGFEERVAPEIESVLYRISQEALTNTLRHAGAKQFKLSIIKGYPQIIFLAEDDGIGFDVSALKGHRQALGLLSMRERAAMLGGKFTLRAADGEGTRIRIEIPLKENAHDG
jgi:PAS domain S-box-containing protein